MKEIIAEMKSIYAGAVSGMLNEVKANRLLGEKISELEAAIAKHESDGGIAECVSIQLDSFCDDKKHESESDCEHEFESCPAVKCEKCGLIIED